MTPPNRVSLEFGGLSNSMHETKTQVGRAWESSNCQVDHSILQARQGTTGLGSRPSASGSDLCYGSGYGKYTGNEMQRLTSTATSVTFTLTWNSQTTSSLNWNCAASDVQSALEALSNINVGDVHVSGGALNAFPIDVEFRGQYASTDVAAITVNSTLAGGTLTITEYLKGGAFEQYLAVVQPNGSGTCTLYGITSSDSFGSNFTWTSLATGLSASDWFFQQYGRTVYGVNATDGILQVPFGGSVVGNSGRPAAPNNAPVLGGSGKSGFFSQTASSTTLLSMAGATFASTGFANAPAIAAGPAGTWSLTCQTTGIEANTAVSITATLASSQNFQYRDAALCKILWSANQAGATDIDPSTVRIVYQNVDGTTDIETPYYGRDERVRSPGADGEVLTYYNFTSLQRSDRSAVKKITLYFTIRTAPNAKIFYVEFDNNDNWLCDTLNFTETKMTANGRSGFPTSGKIEYAYSYYKTSTSQESPLSPSVMSGNFPSQSAWMGSYASIAMSGNKALLTSDKIYLYRREKSSGRWRRLANADGTYGIANVTSGTTSFSDHNWEHELANYPTPVQPPFSSSSVSAEQIGAWKGSLVVAGRKQAWFSRVGAPETFAPSPDDGDIDNAALLLQGPGRATTMYVSPNRSENLYNISGQDAIYICTDQSTYASLTDQPSDIIAFRPIKSARGSVGYRAAWPYEGSLLVGTKNGLWLYRVSRMWADLDGGNDTEEELTKEVRRSYERLISPYWRVTTSTVGTNTGGTFTITFRGVTTSGIPYNASARQIKDKIEALSNVNVGDVEVITTSDTSVAGCLSNAASTIDIRFVGQWVGVTHSLSDLSVATSGITPSGNTMTVTRMCAGGISSLVVTEYIDNIWLFNGRSYLMRSRMGKWNEGVLQMAVKASVANRANGLILFDNVGGMYRIEDKAVDDFGSAFNWRYTTGVNVSSRQRLVRLYTDAVGSPKVKVIRDDKAGGNDETVLSLSGSRNAQLNINLLPGVRHTFEFFGSSSAHSPDEIHACDIAVQEAGDGFGA